MDEISHIAGGLAMHPWWLVVGLNPALARGRRVWRFDSLEYVLDALEAAAQHVGKAAHAACYCEQPRCETCEKGACDSY